MASGALVSWVDHAWIVWCFQGTVVSMLLAVTSWYWYWPLALDLVVVMYCWIEQMRLLFES